MKTTVASICAVLTFFLTSCFEKGKFHYVKSINQSFRFELNKSGSFNDVAFLDAQQIADQLLDLDNVDNYEIEEVEVSGVKMKFNLGNGNTANSLNYRVYAADESETSTFISNEGETSIPQGFLAQLAIETIVNKYLNTKGVALVKKHVTRLLKGANSDNATAKGMFVEIEGNVPSGQLVANISIDVAIDITYNTCEDVPMGMASEACD
ncbi:hypothetical protein LAG90_03320 [Marinilongibacter aquaticus]|uniref:hypothetical protein n=1 Tax=Marinilongibacter aquaticus TaxID=2975157 RepID=UPI0021BDE547|nr:hypothetical protein [Marinilongibacter aquaticus]UBM59679.1 hypothetical protein LAG90_03320 [Marinilongibacter aquaticus]